MRNLFIFFCFGIVLSSTATHATFPEDSASEEHMRATLESLWRNINKQDLDDNNLTLTSMNLYDSKSALESFLAVNTLDPFLGRIYKDMLPFAAKANLDLLEATKEDPSYFPSPESTLASNLDLSNNTITSKVPGLHKKPYCLRAPHHHGANIIGQASTVNQMSTLDRNKMHLAISTLFMLNKYLRSYALIYQEEWDKFQKTDCNYSTEHHHLFFSILKKCEFNNNSPDSNLDPHPVTTMSKLTYFCQSLNFGNITEPEDILARLDAGTMENALNCLQDNLLNIDPQCSHWNDACTANIFYDMLNATDLEWNNISSETAATKYLTGIIDKSFPPSENSRVIPQTVINTLYKCRMVQCADDLASLAYEIKDCTAKYLQYKTESDDLNKLYAVHTTKSTQQNDDNTTFCYDETYGYNNLAIEDSQQQQQLQRSPEPESISSHIEQLGALCGVSDIPYIEENAEIMSNYLYYQLNATAYEQTLKKAQHIFSVIAKNEQRNADDTDKFDMENTSFREQSILAITNLITWYHCMLGNRTHDQESNHALYKLSSSMERGIFGENSTSHIIPIQDKQSGTLLERCRIVETTHRSKVILLIAKYMKLITLSSRDAPIRQDECPLSTLNKEDIGIMSMIYIAGSSCSFAGIKRTPKPPIDFIKDDTSMSSQKEYFIKLFAEYLTDYMTMFHKRHETSGPEEDNYFHGIISENANPEIIMGIQHAVDTHWLSLNKDTNIYILNTWWDELEIDKMACQSIYKFLAFCSHITKLHTLETCDKHFVPSTYFGSLRSGIQISLVCALAATMFTPARQNYSSNDTQTKQEEMKTDWPVYVSITNKLVSTVQAKLYTNTHLDKISLLHQVTTTPCKWLQLMNLPHQSVKAKNQAYLLLLSSIYWNRDLQPILDIMKRLNIRAVFSYKP
ncbi:MAG: hypothetical protein QS748_07970 [Candidatus Endonucleobacter bathymodioli]|uniref:Uncharacterized protein n=1 Tax=Candidatus Endonucleibacter bathymodioli TaxID=539814 RepID=A0AA90SY04_9GAMM|nr:hypothetical protein [Candidatus Endonucleobacter bathymodioli]